MEIPRPAFFCLTAAILVACYAPTLRGMIAQWQTDEDMGHGFIVPAVIAWILWKGRARWKSVPLEFNGWGFVVLAAGAGMHAVGALGGGLFAASIGFLLSVTGAVLCLGGFSLLRAWAFPLALALFMLPKLAIVYNQVTLPLQLLASKTAASLLTLFGIGVIREGNILDVRGHQVAVAEACNGIRFLLPLGFIAVVLAYVSDSKPWMRWAILGATVPLAILANAVRVAAAAWIPALDSGTPHQAIGWVIFALSVLVLFPFQRILNSLYARYST